MFDWLLDLVNSGAWWVYLLVVAVIVFDAVFPVLPSETALITGGILAARGELVLAGVIAAGFVGSGIGDNVMYTLGSRPGRRARDRLFRSDKARDRLKRARHQLDERPWLVGVARFVPGGRSAMTFSSGTLGLPRARFNLYILPGGALWAVAVTLLGYAGGKVFQSSFWLPLAVSLGMAALLTGILELVRRGRRSREPARRPSRA